MRIRSRVVRIRIERARIRAIVRVTASSLNAQTNHPREMQPAFLLKSIAKVRKLGHISKKSPALRRD